MTGRSGDAAKAGRAPGEWYPHRPTHDIKAAEPATKNPNVTEGPRQDRVLFGPDGKEIARIRDRPFRGYRRDG